MNLTCKDCVWMDAGSSYEYCCYHDEFITGMEPKSEYLPDKNTICPYFRTKKKETIRFCKIAHSIDRLADVLIEEALNARGDKVYYFVKEPSSYCSDKAKVKRKVMKWLMEIEK